MAAIFALLRGKAALAAESATRPMRQKVHRWWRTMDGELARASTVQLEELRIARKKL